MCKESWQKFPAFSSVLTKLLQFFAQQVFGHIFFHFDYLFLKANIRRVIYKSHFLTIYSCYQVIQNPRKYPGLNVRTVRDVLFHAVENLYKAKGLLKTFPDLSSATSNFRNQVYT